MNLPTLSLEEQAHSALFTEYLQQQMLEQPMAFVDFMQAALYEPKYGYYRSGAQKFGEAGDFTTAPEISPLFSHCLARQTADILAEINSTSASVLEVGAGSGIMAVEILLELERLQQLPAYYYILELSSELQMRQAETINQHAAHLLNRVKWLTSLSSTDCLDFKGVILANEVLDAMPVQRFHITQNHEVQAYAVCVQNNQFIWNLQPADPALELAVRQIEQQCGALPMGYNSEINLLASPWIQSLSDCLQQGVMLLVDYGYSRSEYYHPQREQGTLMCHYRHHAHPDPLINVGVQDITTYVDFTVVAEAAIASDLEVIGYSTQANFLLATGLLDQLSQSNPDHIESHLRLAQQVKTLTLPTEMGERFKVLGLSKDMNMHLVGFAKDMRIWL